MKEIYILINSLAGGGAERQVSIISKFLNVKKIILLERDIKYKVNKNKILFLSNFTNKTSPVIKTFFIPIYSFLLVKKIKPNSIVISFLERSNFVNLLAKILFNKHICIIHELTFPQKAFKKIRIINKILIKLLYRYSDILISNSTLNWNIKNMKVIYNPYEIEKIVNLSKEKIPPKELKIFNDNKVIINVGRLSYPKGQWHLIRIFPYIKEHIKNCKLIILGDGNLRRYFEKLIEELEIKNDVYLLGFKKNPFKYISKAEVFVLSSLWEGLPNALIEAMICKTPVISTNCTVGIGEILDKNLNLKAEKIYKAKYGIIVPELEEKILNSHIPLTKNEKILADAIIEILRNGKLRKEYSQKAFYRVKDFEVKKIINEYKKLIKNFQ